MLKVEMLKIQINIMAMLLSEFEFLSVYRADLVSSRTLSFAGPYSIRSEMCLLTTNRKEKKKKKKKKEKIKH